MLGDLPDYPWDLLTPFRDRASRHEGGIVDLSIGSPVDPTPQIVQDALVSHADSHSYPHTAGTGALRTAVIDWFARRRGVVDLADSEVMPTIGSKELVALLPFMLGLGPQDTVVQPATAYPTYAIGAALAGASIVRTDDPNDWPIGTSLVWVNSPGNPTGRVLDVDELRVVVERARELGAVIASDECYVEFGWEGRWATDRIPSILDPDVISGDRSSVIAVCSLSKQSNLAGYRAAFVAGSSDIVSRLVRVRKHAGLMPPGPIQAATVAALGDSAHVERQREIYRARRAVLIPAVEKAGFRVDRSEAGLYLWISEERGAWTSIDQLASLGILAAPGTFYGNENSQHVRISLTAADERIAAAADRLHESAL